MKTRFLWVIFILCLLIGIGTSWYLYALRPVTSAPDLTVKVNRLLLALEREWPEIADAPCLREEQNFDYAVITEEGEVLFQTREDVSVNLSQATANYDVIRDLKVDGEVVGKLIVRNASAELQVRGNRQLALLFLALSTLVAFSSLAYAIYLHKTIVKPFREMKGFAEQIAMGNLDVPLSMDRGNLFGAFTESFDIMREELKASRLREEAALKSRKELVAQLSHDVKTPVASIKAMAEVLELSAQDPSLKETYAAINGKADQIDKLVSNLFHATLEELEHLEVTPEELPSSELVSILQSADPLHRIRSLHVEDGVILGDPLRISQVFGNLISNSYKYAGTEITVDSHFEDGGLVLEISDQGGGVPEEELDLILQKFHRGSNASGKDGAGLGLYISKNLMERMGGSLTMRVDGSKFTAVVRFTLA